MHRAQDRPPLANRPQPGRHRHDRPVPVPASERGTGASTAITWSAPVGAAARRRKYGLDPGCANASTERLRASASPDRQRRPRRLRGAGRALAAQAAGAGWTPIRSGWPPAGRQAADVRPPEVAQAEELIDAPSPRTRSWACSSSWPPSWAPAGARWPPALVPYRPGPRRGPGRRQDYEAAGTARDEEWTKTRSKRRVAIGPAMVELLRARRVEQAKRPSPAGVSLSPDA